MLTCAHAWPHEKNHFVFSFTPGYFKGKSTYQKALDAWAILLKAFGFTVKNPPFTSFSKTFGVFKGQLGKFGPGQDAPVALDMAVIRLREPLGDIVGWWDVVAAQPDSAGVGKIGGSYWRIGYPDFIGSYPADFDPMEEPVFDSNFDFDYIKGYDYGIVACELGCEIFSADGDSGGPYFGFDSSWFNDPYVLGVHSSMRKGLSVGAGGPALKAMVNYFWTHPGPQ